MKNDTNDRAAANDESEAPSETNSPETGTESEIESLRRQLKAKEDEVLSLNDRLMRQAAEFENSRKRTAREREEALRFANEGLVRDLLPVVDNLERAIAHAKTSGNGDPLVEGVEMVLKGLYDALGKHNVTQVTSLGTPFNPQLHEAMAQIESADHAANTVVDELQKGYLLWDRLIRPALVTVAKGPKTNEKKNENG